MTARLAAWLVVGWTALAQASTPSDGWDSPSATRLLRPRRVVVTSSIVILDDISFRPGSARLEARSLPMIEAIAGTLRSFDELRVEIVGQAGEGEPAAPRLALRRAAAVRDALVGRGVPPERLAIGHERGKRTVSFRVTAADQ